VGLSEAKTDILTTNEKYYIGWRKAMKDLGSKVKQIMLDTIKSRDSQETCREKGDGQARQMISFAE